MAVPIFQYYQNSLINSAPRMKANFRRHHDLREFLSIRRCSRALPEVFNQPLSSQHFGRAGSLELCCNAWGKYGKDPGLEVGMVMGARQQPKHSRITFPGPQDNDTGEFRQGRQASAETSLKSPWFSYPTACSRDGKRTQIFRHHYFTFCIPQSIQKHTHQSYEFSLQSRNLKNLQNIQAFHGTPVLRGTAPGAGPW